MGHFDKAPKEKSGVQHFVVPADFDGQRIDNFLINRLKGVPKSKIYRILRKGEVRVNKKRISPFYKLIAGDSIRLPPIMLAEEAKQVPPSRETMELLASRILY